MNLGFFKLDKYFVISKNILGVFRIFINLGILLGNHKRFNILDCFH